MLDPNDYDETDLYEYQCLIGKLMYLVCETRPDIAYTVGQLINITQILEKVPAKLQKE